MMRLIDADAIKNGKFHSVDSWTPVEQASWQWGWNDAIDAIINGTPTVDAVEVVRCKDCKHWLQRSAEVYRPVGIEGCACDSWIRITQENDYCSRGERKDG